MLEAGKRICGRFELVRSEGEGTGSPVFGEAWAALDLESGDMVRLVFIGEELVADAGRRSALRASLEAALGHRDEVLVPLAFVGEEEGRIIVAYEGLYAGIALADVLADLDVGDRSGEVGRFIVEVALSLALLHGRGLVHGALGLDTIFVWERGNAVWQYGLAAACDPSALVARAGDHLLAPELRAGRPPTPASDVYCWAACIAAFVSGLPVDEAIALAREGGILTAATGLVELLGSALADAPEERPATGGAVIRRLVEIGLIVLPDAEPDEEAITALAEAELEPIAWESLPPEVDAAPAAASWPEAEEAADAEAAAPAHASSSSASSVPEPVPAETYGQRPPAADASSSSSSALMSAAIPDFDLPDDLGGSPSSPVGELPLPGIGDLPPLPPSLDDFSGPPEFDLSPPPTHEESMELSPPSRAALPLPPPEADDKPSALGSLVSAALDLSLAPPRPAPPRPEPAAAESRPSSVERPEPEVAASDKKPSAPPPRPAQVVKAAPKPAPAPPARGARVHVLASPVAETSGVRPAEISGSGLRAVEASGARPAEAVRAEVSEGAPSTAALVSVALSTARPSLAAAVDSATKIAPEPDAPVLRRDRRTHPLGWDISEIHAHATVPPEGEAPAAQSPSGPAVAAARSPSAPRAAAAAAGGRAQAEPPARPEAPPSVDLGSQDSAVIDPRAVVEATSVPVQPGTRPEAESHTWLIVLGVLAIAIIIWIMMI